MYWIITEDKINNDGLVAPRVGVGRYDSYWKSKVQKTPCGSAERTEVINTFLWHWESLNPSMDHEFRCLDADDNVYYVGRCMDPTLWDESKAFDCLDWCMADAGCTEFQFRKVGEEKWIVL